MDATFDPYLKDLAVQIEPQHTDCDLEMPRDELSDWLLSITWQGFCHCKPSHLLILCILQIV